MTTASCAWRRDVAQGRLKTNAISSGLNKGCVFGTRRTTLVICSNAARRRTLLVRAIKTAQRPGLRIAPQVAPASSFAPHRLVFGTVYRYTRTSIPSPASPSQCVFCKNVGRSADEKKSGASQPEKKILPPEPIFLQHTHRDGNLGWDGGLLMRRLTVFQRNGCARDW